MKVPVINVSSLLSPVESSTSTVEAIGKACLHLGFFYVVEHGIDPSLIRTVQRLSRDFFRQPRDLKATVERSQENMLGWSDSELTKRRLDLKEVFDYTSEKELDGKNRWPENIPEFKPALVEYREAMLGLAERLLAAVFQSLGLGAQRFEAEFKGSPDTSKIRLNYYPPSSDPTTEQLGVGPHSDPASLTILWQDEDVTSLQVQKDGVWHDVPPIPHSFVINIGDMVQVWSNGLYKAPIHRVLANPNKERYSTPFFYRPHGGCLVAPLESQVSKENPAKYRPILWAEFQEGRNAGNYADLGEELQITHYQIIL